MKITDPKTSHAMLLGGQAKQPLVLKSKSVQVSRWCGGGLEPKSNLRGGEIFQGQKALLFSH